MQLLPFYLVCDESGSMHGDPVDTLNAALPELHAEISSNPTVSDKTRFALIGFSTTATVLQPLADVSELTSLPALEAGGLTSYDAAFRLLKVTIEQDIADLKGAGYAVFRPIVFFLSDGIPTDLDWITSFRELTESPYAPKIIAFGIGQADPEIITTIANVRAFVQDTAAATPAVALREFATSLTRSIVYSTRISPDSGLSLRVDADVPGFTTVPLDEL